MNNEVILYYVDENGKYFVNPENEYYIRNGVLTNTKFNPYINNKKYFACVKTDSGVKKMKAFIAIAK